MQYICQSETLAKLCLFNICFEKIMKVWKYGNVPFQQLLNKDMKCFDQENTLFLF